MTSYLIQLDVHTLPAQELSGLKGEDPGVEEGVLSGRGVDKFTQGIELLIDSVFLTMHHHKKVAVDIKCLTFIKESIKWGRREWDENFGKKIKILKSGGGEEYQFILPYFHTGATTTSSPSSHDSSPPHPESPLHRKSSIL